MTAASYWSLLAPAIEMATHTGIYGEKGQYAFIPVSIGFILGAAFVFYADRLMNYLVRNIFQIISCPSACITFGSSTNIYYHYLNFFIQGSLSDKSDFQRAMFEIFSLIYFTSLIY